MMTTKRTWNLARPLVLLSAVLVTTTVTLGHAALADPNKIALTDADQQRLDIRFSAVRPASAADGFPVPAQVIHSPQQRSRIKSYFHGTLARWQINSGDRVTAGTAIATVSSPQLMQIQEQWLAARHHLSDMQQQLNKDTQLLRDGVISEQRLQQTQRQYRQAQFGLQTWQQQLAQAGITADDLQAVLNGQLQPGEYVLRAAAAGVVSRQSLGVGDTVAAYQVLASTTNTADLWLQASIPSALAKQLRYGDSLQVVGSPVPLTLTGVTQEVVASTQRVAITARFSGATGYLPGQQLTLLLPAQQAGVRVPATAVTHTEGSTFVYVRQRDGIEIRELQLLPLGRDYLATSGIRDGEQLVVQGSAQLKGIQLGLGGGE